MSHLLLILIGGPAAIGVTASAAVILVHRHGDPEAARVYLAELRARRAATIREAYGIRVHRVGHAEPTPTPNVRPKAVAR
ncbi:hypothetical protein E1258_09450 [Micromonospora sp. KC207]|uniref:hypothetical protein n=1 Tax=Micromonospora sp. KC207 TaxID=2530377 RepID=UPI001053F1C3|nr:hypothetical protein [Micromonospora sp. KC207]TDC63862.1 hypothetical protein E1258_09450 [Micromonospora sp. KC207]